MSRGAPFATEMQESSGSSFQTGMLFQMTCAILFSEESDTDLSTVFSFLLECTCLSPNQCEPGQLWGCQGLSEEKEYPQTEVAVNACHYVSG